MRAKPLPLRPGDVIKTHPVDGFWGCAVVLSYQGRTEKLSAVCHIATTDLVIRHDFSPGQVDLNQLSVLVFDRYITSIPGILGVRTETCIGIYTAKTSMHSLLGSVDPIRIYPSPLTFEVGDATQGRFPLCGPVTRALGSEAVVAWRRIHDRDTLLALGAALP